MFLAIYKRGNKYYFNFVKKLTERFTVTNEKFETVKLGYRQKIESYPFNGWGDFRAVKKILLEKYSLRMYIAEVRFSDKTQIKLVLEMMNNPFYSLVLKETQEENADVIDGDSGIRVVELWDKTDWDYAQEQFKFESDFWCNLW